MIDSKEGEVEMEDKLRQEARQKYDSRKKEHKRIMVGNLVRIKHKTTGEWNLIGQVVNVEKDQTYFIRTKAGQLYLRHKSYLRLLREDNSNNTRPKIREPRSFMNESSQGGHVG